MVWHIFPWQIQDPISWEGHLAGGIIGLGLSIYYRNEGPQKPIKKWEDEENESLDYMNDNDEENETENETEEEPDKTNLN